MSALSGSRAIADDERTPDLTPTPRLSPAELTEIAIRLAKRIPAVRDANAAELIKILEQLRRELSAPAEGRE